MKINKNAYDLNGKVAIITGASGTIGCAIAKELARDGAVAVLAGRNVKKMEEIRREIEEAGYKADVIEADVADRVSAKYLADETVRRYGHIDILCNNAGMNGGKKERVRFWEFDEDFFEQVIAVDLVSVFHLSKYVGQYMVKQQKGVIINTASVTGMSALRNQIAYCTAKAGVIHMTKAMAIEGARDGIRVNALCPGSVLNENLKEVFFSDPVTAEAQLDNIPMHRTGEPEEQAAMVAFLASDDASYITGHVFPVDGGWIAGAARKF